MRFKLLTSGELRLTDRSGAAVPFPEKGLMILALLLAGEERQLPRGRVAQLIWGGKDTARALTNLRQTVSRIADRQQQLGQQFLDFTASHVSLASGVPETDLGVVMTLRDVSADGIMPALGLAMTFYRAPFLDDVTPPSPAFASWRLARQQYMAGVVTDAVARAAPLCKGPEDRMLVREIALRLLRHDPQNQAAARVHALVTEDGTALPAPLPDAQQANTLALLRDLYQHRNHEGRVPATVAAPSPDTPPRLALTSLPRLAILPPERQNSSPLVDAMLEDVTIGLCASRTLRVVAPYTAQRISREMDKPQLIVDHAISYVLDTRLTQAAGERTLFAQLVFVPGDEVVWAERFPIDDAQFLENRQRIAMRLVASVSDSMGRNEAARLSMEANPQAYLHFLVGRSQLNLLSLPSVRRARKAFRAALQERPDFGQALGGLARTNHLEWLLTARGEPELLLSAERYALQAIERCQDATIGYRELGVTRLFLGHLDGSVEALMQAEDLSPHYADVLTDLGDTLIHSGRPAEGLVKIERAIDLNPLSPDGYFWAAAGANFYLHDYAAACRYIDRMEDSAPAYRLKAACRAMMGDMREARALSRKVREQLPDFDVDQWISVLPIREAWQKELYREALLKAGL